MQNIHFHLLNTIDVSFYNIASVSTTWPDNCVDSYLDKGRDEDLLFYSIHGDRIYTIEGQESLRIRDNDVLYAPSNSHYLSRVKVIPPRKYAFGICIRFNIKDENGNKIIIKDRPQWVAHDIDGQLYELFSKLHNAIMQGTGEKLYSKALLSKLMDILITNVRKDKSFDSSTQDIYPAVEKIERYPQDHICISELADMCSLSESAFRRKFIQYSGMSPVKYRNKIRVQKSLELLKSGLYSIEKVAEVMGFTDQAHLSNVIKKVTGKTPKEIKADIRNGHLTIT